ncbi:MAG TPA: hypothetical protein VL688_12950 [Verrucomicrobiae bacterium]|jgi:hypothetical protein|nr:hypothetical protein [Verrucomicrobiae bacterium]
MKKILAGIFVLVLLSPLTARSAEETAAQAPAPETLAAVNNTCAEPGYYCKALEGTFIANCQKGEPPPAFLPVSGPLDPKNCAQVIQYCDLTGRSKAGRTSSGYKAYCGE